jgi:predicted house-cleaning noncanonical NTP pyrophosphatase (MazG superfamily)
MYKYEKQFRAENPQTIRETDRQYDLSNYKDWLERKLEDAIKKLIENNEDMDLETLMNLLM